MSKAVLISIQPKWCEKIVSGRKTLELRKTAPRLKAPFKCYIYCTKKDDMGLLSEAPLLVLNNRVCNGKVIGEFVCDNILRHCEMSNADIAEAQSLVRRGKILEYAREKEVFGWHISNLVVYDKPRELGDFSRPKSNYPVHDCWGCGACAIERPPQSWCYVEEL